MAYDITSALGSSPFSIGDSCYLAEDVGGTGSNQSITFREFEVSSIGVGQKDNRGNELSNSQVVALGYHYGIVPTKDAAGTALTGKAPLVEYTADILTKASANILASAQVSTNYT